MAVLFFVLGLGEFFGVLAVVGLGDGLFDRGDTGFILGFTMPYFVCGFLAALVPERLFFAFAAVSGHLIPYCSLFCLPRITEIGLVFLVSILTQLLLMAAWVAIYRRFNPSRRGFVPPRKPLPAEGQAWSKIEIKQKY